MSFPITGTVCTRFTGCTGITGLYGVCVVSVVISLQEREIVSATKLANRAFLKVKNKSYD